MSEPEKIGMGMKYKRPIFNLIYAERSEKG